jgi:hypothetical protein
MFYPGSEGAIVYSVVAIPGCIAAYIAAKSRGRSGNWWVLGWVGLIIVMVLPRVEAWTVPEIKGNAAGESNAKWDRL